MQFLRLLSHRGMVWAWRLLIVAVLFFNLRLYWPSPLAENNHGVPRQIVALLAANRSTIDAGCPQQMQELFPEGFYFSWLFHGMTWVELALRDESHTEQAIREGVDCLAQLNSSQGRAAFPSHLPPDYGMFYAAWKCSLRAGVVLLQQGNDAGQLAELRRECDTIRTAIEQSETPFLASYEGSVWPCDTAPAIHAMAAYDRITQTDRYADTIAQWLSDARERLDPETGLLPHTASLPDGRPVGVARATSQGIILRLLPDIDPEFAKEQYERFRTRFLTTFAGAPCVLEYPSGVSGSGDVDSGPLIFGRSLSGTVMMIAVAQIYGDQSLANAIAQAGETVGLPWTSNDRKNYVGGLLPIGDIIVGYAHIARPWFAGQQHHPDTKHHVPNHWRWPIHAWSLVVLLPFVVAFFRRRQKAAS